jgi:hypothetical protein
MDDGNFYPFSSNDYGLSINDQRGDSNPTALNADFDTIVARCFSCARNWMCYWH